MTMLIELVEQKNADGFRAAVETKLAEKVSDVLDALKPMVAQKFFSGLSEDALGSESGEISDKEENLSNTTEPGPGKGQAHNQKGGFTTAGVKVQAMPGTHLATDVKLPGQGDHPQKTLASEAHVGFKAVEASARKSGARNPAAVAAAVGYKKYGKRRMQKAAHEGKPVTKVS